MNWIKPKTYAVKHRDEVTRMASRSGGVFTALSDDVLRRNGIIYGCALDEDFRAVHIRAASDAERNRMRGSKYVQSDLGNVFNSVKKDLEDGTEVLFSGTSCQIAGLKSFLGKEYGNLLCVDIVCHGVPSPEVWKKYLKWQEKKIGKIVSADFRNKKDFGWGDHVETLVGETGKKVDSRVYTTIFFEHSALRPCCYKCPYKSVMHPADVTLADYWGIDRVVPGFNDNKGVSLVLINNDKGNEAFNQIMDSLHCEPTRIEDSMQTSFIRPWEAPKDREMFWKAFRERDFNYVARRYGEDGIVCHAKKLIRKCIRKAKKIIKKCIKD